MIAYKLMRIKNGKLYPLFINRNQETPVGRWLKAEPHPTEGYALRVGWHCCLKPIAPHLKMTLSNGEQRVWVECEVENYTTYNRPESQGGVWLLAGYMKIIKTLRDD